MIKRLLLLNGLAVFCAVVNHAVVWELTAMFWWADRYTPAGVDIATQLESWRYFSVRLIDQLVIFAVFAFLFISGYFIAVAAGREQKSIPWKLVLQRIKFLVVPYLLWTTVIIALNLLQGRVYTPWEILKTYLFGSASPPYYYVSLVVQLYILSPLFVPLARDRWKILLIFTGLLQLLALAAHYASILNLELGRMHVVIKVLQEWHLVDYTFWFVLGTVIGFHLQKFRPVLVRWRWFLLFGLLLTFVVGFIEWGALQGLSGREWISPQVIFSIRVYILFLLLSFVAFEDAPFLFSSVWSKLGPRSYGIYLVHAIPLELAARFIYLFAPEILAYQIIFMPLIVLVGLSVPVIMMEVVNRSFIRQYYKYIFG